MFLDCVKYSPANNQLRSSQYEGLISLISKPGKDNFCSLNYQLLTLLSCDYKIILKVNRCLYSRKNTTVFPPVSFHPHSSLHALKVIYSYCAY